LQDKLANTIKPLHQSYKGLYRSALKDRFGDPSFIAKSSLSETTARACDFATICTEYRQFDSYMDRYEKADQLKQGNAGEGEIQEQDDRLTVQFRPTHNCRRALN
jgi:hypothetical protein